jgi:quinol monooxygenase YgiN
MRYNQSTKAIFLSVILAALFSFVNKAFPQDKNRNIRIARLVIDPAKLDLYKAALKEEVEAAIRIEPGVLSLYAVYDKKDPTHVTVFEIYANEEAYRSHIQTPHFKKYKESTAAMVKSLELAEVSPIALGSKSKLPSQ